ncbi:28212_t:CDS:2, partial [Gigaspora margarita]
SHMMRVPRPDGVPDWTAGEENEESDYRSGKRLAIDVIEELP